MKSISIVCFFLVHVHVFGQFTDDFSDGDFTNNPRWSGDGSSFVVQNGVLRSDGSAATGVVYLSTPSTVINEATWEFLIRLNFAPSGSNQVRVYLVSDNKNLEGALNGYYIEIGQSGSDFIRFYRQNGFDQVKLFSGSNPLSFPGKVRMHVTRDKSGNWQLHNNHGEGSDFVSEEDSFHDDTHTTTNYFGVVCRHTKARNKGFFFDDFIVTVAPDTSPPKITKIRAVSETAVDVYFNERVDKAEAETITNYTIDKGIGQPSSVSLDDADKSLAHLSLTNPLSNNTTYEMTIRKIEDVNGNTMTAKVKTFTVLILEIADADDIIVNEVMADPNPAQGLPEAEYVEIYNRSNKYIGLANYMLNDASLTTDQTISPDEYVILCNNRDKVLFESYGQVIGVASWNTLTNKGVTITLTDAGNLQLIDEVRYDKSWYNSIDKHEGGWSLELIDPENKCGEESNWTASIDESGGTPGRRNSVFGGKPDLTGPRLLSVVVISQEKLILKFDERLDAFTYKSAGYAFKPLLSTDHVILRDNRKEITIAFSNPIKPSVAYKVTISQLRDCNGNLIGEENSNIFAFPETALPGDLLINELLYNPITTGGDFVEIYNHSLKYIDLKEWMIANGSREAPQNMKKISGDHLMITPQQYLVFTENPEIVSSDYPRGVLKNFVGVSSLPSFPNDGQGVLLVDPQNNVFDYFPYEENMQHTFLDNTKGVSLERISFDNPANNRENWHSAASSEGFATPGYVNSQAFDRQVNISDQIVISPEVFLPDQSGQNDFTTINYSFDQPGFVASVSIVDVSGRVIKKIAENELLATEGFFQWDGTMGNGRKARSGVYIVLFESFDLSGNQQTHRKRVVLAAQL